MKVDKYEDIKKVILFDSWTKGSRHIFRLLDHLKESNIDILLVHIGSWGDEPGRAENEVINGLKVNDISMYGDLETVLLIEKPDAVLFLSLDPLAHRAFNRYCMKDNIPTVHLYHGVHSVFTSLSLDNKKLLGYWLSLVKIIIDRLGYIFYIYLKALVKTNASFNEWKNFFNDIYKKIFGFAVDIASKDARTDIICVFNDFDKKQALNKFYINKENIYVVGYPDILKFKGLEDSICKYINEDSYNNETILYIGTGARGTRLRLANDELYFKHLLRTYRELQKYNRKVIFKLHYSRINSVIKEFNNIGEYPVFCDDNEFIYYLIDSCGAIVEPSTAALVPVLMGKPIFMTQYDMLDGLKFGNILESYPKAISIFNISDFIKTTTPVKFSNKKIRDWIKLVSGPLPSSMMALRVVKTIMLAINKSPNKVTL
jgi:hypothetical protein